MDSKRVVCSTCNDTHEMELRDSDGSSRLVMCTRCPVPCDRCGKRGGAGPTGPFCVVTPCDCACHLRTAKPEPANDALPPVLTVDELAVLMRMNRNTVYLAIQRHEIPGVRRIGKTLRISRDAVLEWMHAGQRVKAAR